MFIVSAEGIDVVSYFKSLPSELMTEEVCLHCLSLDWYVIKHIPHSKQTTAMQVMALKACADAVFYIPEDDLDSVIECVAELK